MDPVRLSLRSVEGKAVLLIIIREWLLYHAEACFSEYDLEMSIDWRLCHAFAIEGMTACRRFVDRCRKAYVTLKDEPGFRYPYAQVLFSKRPWAYENFDRLSLVNRRCCDHSAYFLSEKDVEVSYFLFYFLLVS